MIPASHDSSDITESDGRHMQLLFAQTHVVKCCELDEHYDLMEGVKNVELMEFEEPYNIFSVK